MIQDRAAGVRALLKRCSLGALVFYDLANIRYLCGFSGSDGVLAVTAGGDCFLTDSRYTTQARQEVAAAEIRQYRVKCDGLVDWLKEQAVTTVGFEAATLPYGTVAELREKSPDIEWQPLGEELKPLRALKSGAELAALGAATRLNRLAFAEVLPHIGPGRTEREIALELEFALKRLGGEEKAFDFIVASGVRGAMPHGIASDKVLRAGELVTIDFGVRKGGYHSDETVTLALGAVASRQREIFDTVLAAHDRAIEAVMPGVPLRRIDAVARDHIAERGYGDYFGHGLGHGVGLEVHEYPTVSPRSDTVAEEGMVFTVEPGVYLPEFGGVRIEDMVEVTADGCRLLTSLPKDFRSLPV